MSAEAKEGQVLGEEYQRRQRMNKNAAFAFFETGAVAVLSPLMHKPDPETLAFLQTRAGDALMGGMAAYQSVWENSTTYWLVVTSLVATVVLGAINNRRMRFIERQLEARD